MDLDRIVHPLKAFPELEDGDVETFLEHRKFNSEHLCLEFKQEFSSQSGRFDYQEVCSYLVGFSNSEGGIIIYGVRDDIKDPRVPFPSYVVGLKECPSLEDLSEWAKNYIHPATPAPSIRFFTVASRKVAILKIPPGGSPPYCFRHPKSKGLWYFKKTAGGLASLSPNEVRDLYEESIVSRARQIVSFQQEIAGRPTSEERITTQQHFARPKLEEVETYGHMSIYCWPTSSITIPVPELEQFVDENRGRLSEAFRYHTEIDVFQQGVTFGYFPSALRNDVKSTVRATLYTDGFCAFDSLADHFMDTPRDMNPYWLAYEIERHLQLARALILPRGIDTAELFVDFAYIAEYSLDFGREREWLTPRRSSYRGSHSPIRRSVNLSEIHPFDGHKRNYANDVVKDVMDEVSRIFGFSRTLPGPWDSDGKLGYVKGLEGTR